MEKTTLLDAYSTARGYSRSAVTGISRAQWSHSPSPGNGACWRSSATWSTPMPISPIGSRRVLSEERPVFDRVKPELMLAALAYHGATSRRNSACFDLTRRQIGRILRASPPEAWERTGIVGDRGDRSVNQMIDGAVEHLAHHLQFVIAKQRAPWVSISSGAVSRRSHCPRLAGPLIQNLPKPVRETAAETADAAIVGLEECFQDQTDEQLRLGVDFGAEAIGIRAQHRRGDRQGRPGNM